MKPVVFAANWKMNHGPSQARAFMIEFARTYTSSESRNVIFFPPALSFDAARELIGERPDITFGVQNIYWADSGAFTGELSAPIARDAGARFTLVGHSERRHVFGETDAQCAEKCTAALRAGITPILCIGERLEERDRGHAEDVVTRQLEAALPSLTASSNSSGLSAPNFMIAYEPVWAIGTGRNATPDDAGQIHAVIRETLHRAVGPAAPNVNILYGGSVTPDNVRSLLDAPDVDGVLVGGASLDPAKWVALCTA